MSKVWFITGASKGLGLNLVKKLLVQGYRVAATSRDKDAYKNEIDANSDTFLPLNMDLTNDTDVKRAIDEAVAHFGTIDVVVNNAGYGLMGAIEEVQPEEVHQNFDVNVYGTLNVIRNVLPIMRANKSGHIINISSIGGFVAGFPGFGIYCATKFAVQGPYRGASNRGQTSGHTCYLCFPRIFQNRIFKQRLVEQGQEPN